MILYEFQSRLNKQGLRLDVSFDDFAQKLAFTKRTSETMSEYKELGKEEKGKIKDVGGFVGGELENGKRSKQTTLFRSVLTLDMDNGDSSSLEALDAFLRDKKAVVYSTHTHTPETPRLRVILALKEALTPDEYTPVARYIAAQIGIDAFDDTTYEACRLMYYPSTCKDGEYYFKCYDGDEIDGKAILKDKFTDWTNVAEWPLSSRESERAVRPTSSATGGRRQMKDPATKSGIVGKWCQAYSIEDAISNFLPSVYINEGVSGRYTYTSASTHGGLVVYNSKFAYSHHASDPVSGYGLVNAFDLVRIHKFGALDDAKPVDTPIDELPSTKAMIKLARGDIKVKRLLGAEKGLSEVQADAIVPITDLPDLDKHGMPAKSPDNIRYIFQHDKNLSNIAYDGLLTSIVVRGPVPWSRKTATSALWCPEDESNLFFYIYSNYKIRDEKAVDHALICESGLRYFHPVREYFESLVWDGIPRLDTVLVDYLGAPDDDYTRAVSRKTLVACVKRVFEPGCKFDNMLVLVGKQGQGKSSFFKRLVIVDESWFSDSMTMSDMRSKDAPEKLLGKIILEIPELAGMTKVEVEDIKAFLSRSTDNYRAAYGRQALDHPRQSIIVGTTNSKDGFLRDLTGNRRFWPVKVDTTNAKFPFDALDRSVVDQLWAEAMFRYRENELLYLPKDSAIAIEAEKRQQAEMVTDDRFGLIQEYLNIKLPDNWLNLSAADRQIFCYEKGWKKNPGTNDRETVSNMEIWCECFGQRKESLNPKESRIITQIMSGMPGWEKSDSIRIQTGAYGQQRVYRRRNAGEDD